MVTLPTFLQVERYGLFRSVITTSLTRRSLTPGTILLPHQPRETYPSRPQGLNHRTDRPFCEYPICVRYLWHQTGSQLFQQVSKDTGQAGPPTVI
jgi:hypothetical protein